MKHSSNYWQRIMTRRLSRRRMLHGSAIGGLGLAAAIALGCGEGEEPTVRPTPTTPTTPAGTGATVSPTGTATPKPSYGGTITMSQFRATEALDPHISIGQAYSFWAIITNNAMSPTWPNSELAPELVEKWEVPGDGTEIILTVRQGVKWHNRPPTNGRELTAEDIAFNVMRIAGKLDPQNAVRYQRAGNLINMNRAEVADKYTVRVIMDSPNSGFFRGLADHRNQIVAKDFVEEVGFHDPLKFVGTGGFTVERWENDGEQGEFKRNPDYWRKDAGGNQLPFLDAVRWQTLPDRAAVVAAFLSKQIDWLLDPSKTERQTVQSAYKEAVLHNSPQASWEQLRFNVQRSPFEDARVRRAIFLALDYKDMNDAFYGDGFWAYSTQLNASFPEGTPSEEVAKLPGWNPNTKQQDIEKAKELMKEAGFPEGEFKWRILVDAVRTGYAYESALRIQDQLARIWPQMEVEVDVASDSGVFSKRRTERDFDAVSFRLDATPDAALDLIVHFHTKGSRNYGNFSDPDIDARLEAALRELDFEKRKAILKEVESRVIELAPLITTAQRRNLAFHNPRLTGFRPAPIGPGAADERRWVDRYWLAS